VIAPMTLPGGGTLHEADGIYFTLFPNVTDANLRSTATRTG